MAITAIARQRIGLPWVTAGLHYLIQLRRNWIRRPSREKQRRRTSTCHPGQSTKFWSFRIPSIAWKHLSMEKCRQDTINSVSHIMYFNISQILLGSHHKNSYMQQCPWKYEKDRECRSWILIIQKLQERLFTSCRTSHSEHPYINAFDSDQRALSKKLFQI